MNHHQQSLKYILKYKFCSTREISRKKPWGFYKSIKLDNYTVDHFLKSEYNFYHTTILHILSGEGENVENVGRCIDKAIEESFRVLILEHNPHATDWAKQREYFSDKINYIEKKIMDNKSVNFDQIYIGDKNTSRNQLYIISTIPYFNYNNLFENDIHSINCNKYFGLADGYGIDFTRKIYGLSSENYKNVNCLLAKSCVNLVNNEKLYCVIGGMMFLDILSESTPHSLILFDSNFYQCLYASVIIDNICKCENLKKFDEFIKSPIIKQDMIDKTSLFWNKFSLYDAISKTEKRTSEGKYLNRWRNIVKIGRWRNNYSKVRNFVLSKKIEIKNIDVNDIPTDGVLYSSTINLNHINEKHMRKIISAFKIRDVPTVVRNQTATLLL